MSPRVATVEDALHELLTELGARGYAFVTPTPATHARVIARADKRQARDVRDVLGWSLPFEQTVLPATLFEKLRLADALESVGDALWRSRLRVSSCGDDLFLHSAFPTSVSDSVFFGPDSYRFANLIRTELANVTPGACVVDIGTGSGIGAVIAGRTVPRAHLFATDVNPKALALARINARAANLHIDFLLGDDLTSVPSTVDVAIANPPYVIDDAHRAYRDGGGNHGAAVSLSMARMAIERLAPGGRMVLYTASAIIDGRDGLAASLGDLCTRTGCSLSYRELDPDVFGEELDRAAYAEVERLAVVAAIVTRPV